MSIAELLSLWTKGSDATDQAIGAYLEQLADLGDRLADTIKDLPRYSDGRLMAESSLSLIHSLLKQAGWSTYTQPLEALYGDAATAHSGLYDALGIAPTPSRVAITRALSFSAGQLDIVHAKLAAVLLPQLQLATVVPISQRAMADLIQESVEGVNPRATAKTIVNTASAGLQNEVAASAMDDLPNNQARYYLYLGPESGARHFCKTLQGKAIPEAQLKRLRNGTPLPVPRYGGGYNCRHSMIPITERIRKIRKLPIAEADDLARAQRGGR